MKNHQNTFITKADKGNVTVALDKQEYLENAESFKDTYAKSDKDTYVEVDCSDEENY